MPRAATPMSVIMYPPAKVAERYGLNDQDLERMSQRMLFALAEAAAIVDGNDTSNLYLVIADDDDGEDYTTLFAASTHQDALDKFLSYHEVELERFDDGAQPRAYKLPSGSLPLGRVSLARLPSLDTSGYQQHMPDPAEGAGATGAAGPADNAELL